ncbi:MAG: hypothetical protein FWD54_06570 [Endomicrobia bacterium]|nr:hypothetical protein [Endomicrobiia bacterium]MCL2799920.1 hypothetical protein [Endomicrobiia bacterium]
METALRIRNILFKAFIINYAAVLFVWLLSFTGLYVWAMNCFFSFSAEQTRIYFAYLLGFWKILGAVFFLIPAAAIHWEYKRKK